MTPMVAVQQLLDDRALELVGVTVPAADTELRWVATSELTDPTPFLEGGEVLLTTGLETAGWRSQWHPYVERLVTARVAALGLATGLTHRRVPRALQRACEELGLNLFEVPRQTTFVAVSRAIARMIDEGAEAAARRSLDVQRQLTQAALRQDDQALVRRLASVVGGAAALVGRDGQLEVGPLGTAGLDVPAVVDEVARIRPQGLRAASSLQSGAGTVVVQPVGLSGRPSGWLAVLLPGRPDDLQRSAVATAVSLLSLAAESRRERLETLRRLRARALELLVLADPRTAGIVLASGGSEEPEFPDPVVLVRATGADEVLEDALTALEGTTPLLARVGEELWLAVGPADADRRATTLAGHGLLVGVGDPSPVGEADRSHANAGHALGAASVSAPVVRWEHLVGSGAMAALDRERASSFAASFLAPLAVPGAEELLPTLRSFLRHHGSRAKVAEELGIHRNTVRNRLEQVEAAVGGSLDDPRLRVDAWVALTVAGRTDAP